LSRLTASFRQSRRRQTVSGGLPATCSAAIWISARVMKSGGRPEAGSTRPRSSRWRAQWPMPIRPPSSVMFPDGRGRARLSQLVSNSETASGSCFVRRTARGGTRGERRGSRAHGHHAAAGRARRPQRGAVRREQPAVLVRERLGNTALVESPLARRQPARKSSTPAWNQLSLRNEIVVRRPWPKLAAINAAQRPDPGGIPGAAVVSLS
jgi:hypothetical protein